MGSGTRQSRWRHGRAIVGDAWAGSWAWQGRQRSRGDGCVMGPLALCNGPGNCARQARQSAQDRVGPIVGRSALGSREAAGRRDGPKASQATMTRHRRGVALSREGGGGDARRGCNPHGVALSRRGCMTRRPMMQPRRGLLYRATHHDIAREQLPPAARDKSVPAYPREKVLCPSRNPGGACDPNFQPENEKYKWISFTRINDENRE